MYYMLFSIGPTHLYKAPLAARTSHRRTERERPCRKLKGFKKTRRREAR